MEALHERIARRIEELGLSVTEVAYKAGVTEAAIRGWMSGGYRPRDDKLPTLAKALKWSVRDLLGADA